MESIILNDDNKLSNREKEMYRTLRTNLEFTGVENRVISITSCAPDDGKSTVSFQLACALAESGKSTIYVDADMRRSVFAQRYNIDTEMKGLSHFLSGKIDTSDVIYVTNKEKFYVLPTGVFPSNPTELLGNSRMNVLITALKKVFDYVIIDTPPLGSVIDAAVVSKFCDASMLVLASNTTSRAEAKKVIAQLKTANPNFLGVVLNKVDMKGSGYYYKRYGYGYGSYYGKRKNNDYY